MADTRSGPFKSWFWQPPRPHGETIVGRTVSSLELLYDLVYVAVIGQAAHHLAEDVSTTAISRSTSPCAGPSTSPSSSR